MNPIATQRLAAVAAPFLAAVVVAQSPPRALRCDPPILDAFVARAERDLEVAHSAAIERASPERLAGAALGWLRLGRADRATQTLEAMLARCAADPSDDEAECESWALVTHHWATRVLGDDVAKRSWPRLRGAAARLVDEAGRDDAGTTMRKVALRAHAIACAADLAQRCADAATSPPLDAAARRALADFEAAHWREPLEAFSATPSAHDPDALFPCAIGMLASTHGRAERNLRAALATVPEAQADALDRLVAKAQLATPLADALAEMLTTREPTDDDPGRRLDAAMFALTGSRIATGPGLDAKWMRLRPCLPRGIARIRVDGLSLDGWTCAFEFEVDDGASGRTRGVYRVESRLPRLAGWRQLVVHHGDHAFVAAAIDGASVELPPRELPVTSPDVRAR